MFHVQIYLDIKVTHTHNTFQFSGLLNKDALALISIYGININ